MANEFEYVNFTEVDPSFKPIPAAVRQLKLTKFKATAHTLASGANEGKETIRINSAFTIVNDDAYSGRKLFPTFWVHNPVDQKNIHRLGNQTGVQQEPGESVYAYAERLQQEAPEFRVFVGEDTEKDRVTGEQVPCNKISWSTIQPV